MSLTAISLPKAKTLTDYVFDGCDKLVSASLPSATSIGTYVFNRCSSLSSVSVPSVIVVGNAAFSVCTNLSKIELPSATKIGDWAFVYCSALSAVYMPNVRNIGASSFAQCTQLSIVNFGSTPMASIPVISGDSFDDSVPKSCRFIIPLGMYDEWKASSGWSGLYSRGHKFEGYANAAALEAKARFHVIDNVEGQALDGAKNRIAFHYGSQLVWFTVGGEYGYDGERDVTILDGAVRFRHPDWMDMEFRTDPDEITVDNVGGIAEGAIYRLYAQTDSYDPENDSLHIGKLPVEGNLIIGVAQSKPYSVYRSCWWEDISATIEYTDEQGQERSFSATGFGELYCESYVSDGEVSNSWYLSTENCYIDIHAPGKSALEVEIGDGTEFSCRLFDILPEPTDAKITLHKNPDGDDLYVNFYPKITLYNPRTSEENVVEGKEQFVAQSTDHGEFCIYAYESEEGWTLSQLDMPYGVKMSFSSIYAKASRWTQILSGCAINDIYLEPGNGRSLGRIWVELSPLDVGTPCVVRIPEPSAYDKIRFARKFTILATGAGKLELLPYTDNDRFLLEKSDTLMLEDGNNVIDVTEEAENMFVVRRTCARERS